MAKKTRPGALKACACRSFAVLDDEMAVDWTGCDRQTNRLFAQGHDAKLKSLLIRAGVAGYTVRWTEGDTTHEGDPLAASRAFGFGHQVESGIRGRLDKLTKKAAKPQPRIAAIKVGRWTFAGASIAPDGTATYQPKSGGPKTVAAGKYTEIEESAK